MKRIRRIAAAILALGIMIAWATTSNVVAQGPASKCVLNSLTLGVTNVATRNLGGGTSGAWVTATATFNCGGDVPPGVSGSNCQLCEISTLSTIVEGTLTIIKTGNPVKGTTYGCNTNSNKDSWTARSLKLTNGQSYRFGFLFGGRSMPDGSCSAASDGSYTNYCSIGVTCN